MPSSGVVGRVTPCRVTYRLKDRKTVQLLDIYNTLLTCMYICIYLYIIMISCHLLLLPVCEFMYCNFFIKTILYNCVILIVLLIN